MTKIEVDYMDTPGDQYVIILDENGEPLRGEHGSIRLWYAPF